MRGRQGAAFTELATDNGPQPRRLLSSRERAGSPNRVNT